MSLAEDLPLLAVNNLSDVADVPTALASLGLGSLSQQALGSYQISLGIQAALFEISPSDLGSFFVNPTTLSGTVQRTLTIPPYVFNSGQVVLYQPVVSVNLPFSTTDAFDVTVAVVISSVDGTNVAEYTKSGSVPSGGNADVVLNSGYTASVLAGTDLSVDGGGNVVTAAGGTYSSMVVLDGSWD